MITTTLRKHRSAVLRAVIYCRVSRDPRGTGRSVEEQEQENRRFCDREGFAVARAFVDNDVGASVYSRGARDDFTELCELIEAGGADIVVAWECSRFARDMAVYNYLQSLCRRHGVLWAYNGRIYDLDNPDDQFSTGMDGLIAQREAAMTSMRVRRAHAANAAKGLPGGRNIYGYLRLYDVLPNGVKVLRKVVEHPEQAPVVRECARRCLAGTPLKKIVADLDRRGVAPPQTTWTLRVLRSVLDNPTTDAAREAAERVRAGDAPKEVVADLNQRGVPAGTGWRAPSLRRMLLNPAYARRRVFHGQVLPDVEAAWPELISPADHEDLVVKLTDASRKTTRETRVQRLMSGIGECGVCVAHLAATSAGTQYRCTAPKTETSSGFHVSRPVGAWDPAAGPDAPLTGLDDFVVRLVVARLASPDCLDVFRMRQADAETAAAAREAAELRTRLAEWTEAAKDGTVSPRKFGEIEADLNAKIERAETRSRPRYLPAALIDIAGRPDAAARWQALDLHQRREVVRALVRVQVLPAGRGKRRIDSGDFRVGWRTADGVVWEEA